MKLALFLKSALRSPSPSSLLVLAAVRSEILVWDLSRPCTPVLKKTMHEEGIKTAKFSSTTGKKVTDCIFAEKKACLCIFVSKFYSDSLLASSGQPSYNVRVYDAKTSSFSFSSTSMATTSLSWHPRYDVLAVGSDEFVTLHHIPQK